MKLLKWWKSVSLKLMRTMEWLSFLKNIRNAPPAEIEQIVKECMWEGYDVSSERKEKQWYYIAAKDENDN